MGARRLSSVFGEATASAEGVDADVEATAIERQSTERRDVQNVFIREW
jgi:hypothetical protein